MPSTLPHGNEYMFVHKILHPPRRHQQPCLIGRVSTICLWSFCTWCGITLPWPASFTPGQWAAICHGAQLLAGVDVLKDRTCSAYPACRVEVERAGGRYADIAIDANRDGRVNSRDVRLIELAVEIIERKHPDLVGGLGVYTQNGSSYAHIDARGKKARWQG